MKTDEIVELKVFPEEITIPVKSILDMLGYAGHDDHQITDQVNHLIDHAKRIVEPGGGYVIKPMDIGFNNQLIHVSGVEFNVNKIIGHQLKKASKLAVVVCTIGDKIEKLSTGLIEKNEMLDGYIMNLIGSVAAEAVANYIQQHISKEMDREGVKITNRFSPGYCNWNVDEQFKLFSFFPKNFCGISLTDSALMYPVKSVSAVIGVGEQVEFKEYKCAVCTDDKCLYKKNV